MIRLNSLNSHSLISCSALQQMTQQLSTYKQFSKHQCPMVQWHWNDNNRSYELNSSSRQQWHGMAFALLLQWQELRIIKNTNAMALTLQWKWQELKLKSSSKHQCQAISITRVTNWNHLIRHSCCWLGWGSMSIGDPRKATRGRGAKNTPSLLSSKNGSI